MLELIGCNYRFLQYLHIILDIFVPALNLENCQQSITKWKCRKIYHHMLALRLHDEFSFRIITENDNSKQWGYHHFSLTFNEILSNKRNANGLFIFVWSWKWIFKDIILKMRNRCFILLIFLLLFCLLLWNIDDHNVCWQNSILGKILL